MPSNAVERIFWGRVPIEHAASLIFYRKGEVSQKILAAIKYKGQTELGERMGEQMGVTLKETSWWNDIDCIVPVPLHPRKLRQRGFNQCDSIAKGLSRSTGIPVDNQIIFRQAYTETQTRKGRFDRFTNMSSAFAVCPSHNARNKHVLLIDDVVTTGGTLEACSNQLRSIPNMKVSIYTLAYASQ